METGKDLKVSSYIFRRTFARDSFLDGHRIRLFDLVSDDIGCPTATVSHDQGVTGLGKC